MRTKLYTIEGIRNSTYKLNKIDINQAVNIEVIDDDGFQVGGSV